MKRTIISIALTSILAACGAGSDAQPVAPGQKKPVEQVQPVAQEQQVEQPKIDPIAQHDQLDPMSNSVGTPFEGPKVEEEPVPEWQLKFLNMGVVRAILEYKMVGEPLKAELAAEMGAGVDAWIKADTERCITDTTPTLKVETEIRKQQLTVMCTGQAYGYWALVNGTAGTEGTPRQCLEKGYCGYMFRQYDLTADPALAPMNGLDNDL